MVATSGRPRKQQREHRENHIDMYTLLLQLSAPSTPSLAVSPRAIERSMIFSRIPRNLLEQNKAQPENNHIPAHSITGFRVGNNAFLKQIVKGKTGVEAKRNNYQDPQPGQVKLAPYLSRGHLAPFRHIDDLPLHRGNVSIYFLVLVWGAAGLAFV